MFAKSPLCLSAPDQNVYILTFLNKLNSLLPFLLHQCLATIFFFSSLHIFIIILLFILVNIFILDFSDPRAVAKSWIFSWHEMSVMQSLLSLEISKLTFQLSSKVSPTHLLHNSLDNKGCLLWSETPRYCKADACSAVFGHIVILVLLYLVYL